MLEKRGMNLAKSIKTNKAIILLDGSFHPHLKLVTAAVIIEDNEGNHLGYAATWVLGNNKDINKYRAKLTGVYLELLIANQVIQAHKITIG